MRRTSSPLQLETWSLAAWPAIEQIEYDGWILRFADGHTKRANSVNPLHRSTISVDEKISFCEAAYAQRGLPTVFRLTPFSEPSTLDAALATRGYERIDRTLVMMKSLDGSSDLGSHSAIRRVDLATWLNAFETFGLLSPESMSIRRRIIGKIPSETIPMMTGSADFPTGVNLGVRDGPAIGLFALFVAERVRRNGLGHALVNETLRIASEGGATLAYLQVEETNLPARRLYETLGFTEAYPYWYRVRDR